MPPKRLQSLIKTNDNGELGDLVQRAQAMGELTGLLRAALDDDGAAGIAAASIRDDGELVVLAASPAWAARLRFEADKLIAAARRDGHEVARIKVRVGRLE